jgi:aminoglycoside phosphotransferase (APT) family kinase protein
MHQSREDSVSEEAARVAGLVDEERLARFLDERKLPGAGLALTARFVSGGASNEIFEIRRGEARMALRRPPRIVPKGRNETMLREARVLAALADSDVPHARLLAVCDAPDVLGACFYLMEWVDGWTPMGPLPEPFRSDAKRKQGLGEELIDAIAKLSLVDWRAGGLLGFGRPEGFLERQVDRWLAHLASFRFRELPGLEQAAVWLRAHTPRSFRPGILHGDYQFANVMFHHGAPARMAAVVDWEMSTVGDPLLDLGWVLMGWPDPDEDRGRSGPGSDSSQALYFDYTGMQSRAELMERHAKRSGLALDAIDYYVVLARFKMACVLEGGYARYARGGADNPKMASFGQVVLDMARRAAELAATSKLAPTR